MSIIKQIIGFGASGGVNWEGAWATATAYRKSDQVGNNGDLFLCTTAHTSAAGTEPGVGANWATVWVRTLDSLTADQIAAAAGTGTPSGNNKFVVNDDARMTNSRTPTSHSHVENDITDMGDYSASNHTHSYAASAHTHSPADVVNITITKTETGDLTAAEVAGTIISNYGQGASTTLTLPVAAAGMCFTFVVSTTGNAVYLKANTSDKIYLNGIATDDNDKVGIAAPALGNCITLFTFQTGASAYDWVATSIEGVWVDSGA